MRRILLLTGLLCLASGALMAQDEAEQAPDSDPSVLTDEQRQEFDERLADIAAQRDDIERITARLATLEGIQFDVQNARVDAIRGQVFQDTVRLAQEVLDLQGRDIDVGEYTDRLRDQLEPLPAEAVAAVNRIAANIEFPGSDMPANEIVVKDQQLLQATLRVDAIYESLVGFVDIAEQLGLDEAEEREYLIETLTDNAASRSIFLKLARDDIAVYRAAAAALPADTEIPARLAAAEARVRIASRGLQNSVDMLNRLDLDTRRYRQQLLTTTGEITTDVLDVGIVASLVAEWSVAAGQLAASEGPRLLFRLLLVIGILFLFRYLGRLVRRVVDRGLNAANVNMSALLHKMIVSSAKNIVVFVGILIALSQLGISLGPLLAGVGIAGFIIGFALQDSLANFASGLMILLYRPFDIGDFVEAGGVQGEVSHMSLVNTTFMTFDNQKLIVPNNKIWQSVITNITAQETRRVDLVFGISYGDDIEKAERILRDVVSAHDAVLDDPEPNIRVHELGESSVNFIVRPWVKTDDYWPTYWDLTRAVKLRFDAEGISIPFPQRDVHMIESQAT